MPSLLGDGTGRPPARHVCVDQIERTRAALKGQEKYVEDARRDGTLNNGAVRYLSQVRESLGTWVARLEAIDEKEATGAM